MNLTEGLIPNISPTIPIMTIMIHKVVTVGQPILSAVGPKTQKLSTSPKLAAALSIPAAVQLRPYFTKCILKYWVKRWVALKNSDTIQRANTTTPTGRAPTKRSTNVKGKVIPKSTI